MAWFAFARRRHPPVEALAHDARGVALIEFALSLPLVALLYMGTYQLTDAIACNRKVTITTRAMADLTSQYATLTTSDADVILNSAVQIMAPYDASGALVRITELYTDTNGITKVQWSRAAHGTPLTTGATVALPASMAVNGNYLIYAETRFTYTPIALYGLTNPITLADTTYMSPRVSTSVQLL